VVAVDNPDPLLVYVPGIERDLKASVLMELEKAGECYQPQLKRIARNVLAERFTAGVIDDILKPERVAYEDLARQFSKTDGAEPPSMLKAIFHDVSGNDAILAAWLARDTRDEEIATKEAIPELSKLVNARLDLELPEGTSIAKMRASTLRYVLGNEFRIAMDPATSELWSDEEGDRAMHTLWRFGSSTGINSTWNFMQCTTTSVNTCGGMASAHLVIWNCREVAGKRIAATMWCVVRKMSACPESEPDCCQWRTPTRYRQIAYACVRNSADASSLSARDAIESISDVIDFCIHKC